VFASQDRPNTRVTLLYDDFSLCFSEFAVAIGDPEPCAGYTVEEAQRSGDDFTVTQDGIVDSVWFDDLPAIEGDHYTVSGTTITPNIPLLDDTIVRIRYTML
jgi:hypothetical protein